MNQENEETKFCVYCQREIVAHPFYTCSVGGQDIYTHIGCRIRAEVLGKSNSSLDATIPCGNLDPIVWDYAELVAGRMVQATIRQYDHAAFCWVTLCDDGYLNSVRNSSVELTFDDAKQAIEDNILHYLMYC